MIKTNVYHGKNMNTGVVQATAKIRIEEFANFPYLYDGTVESEEKYLGLYTKNDHSTIIIFEDDKKIIGCCTALPLEVFIAPFEEASLQFEQKGKNIAEYYYLGEMIFLPAYRGRGLAKIAYTIVVNDAQVFGYRHLCFITVDRPKEHKLRPLGYKDRHGLFVKSGFVSNGISFDVPYKTFYDEGKSSVLPNTMQFWEKQLGN